MGSREIKIVHRASMAGILASAAYVVIGLAAPLLGRPSTHVYMMAGGALGSFVIAVESSYIVSALRGKEHPGMAAALAGLAGAPLLALLAPILGALVGTTPWALALAVSSLLEVYPALLGARLSRRLVRASLAGAAYTNALAALYLALAFSASRSLPVTGLGFLYAFPLPMIFSVTVNALPSTYKRRPLPGLAAAAYALVTAAALLSLDGGWGRWSPLLASIALLAYVAGVGAHRAPSILEEALSRKPPRVVAETHKYFLGGHVYVTIISAYLLVLTAVASTMGGVRLGCIIHGFAIGFAGLHIFIHAPMMLPVILGIPTARRYSQAPYVLLSIAAVSPCIGHWLLWPSLIAALLAVTLVVWPPPRTRRPQ